MAGRLQDTREIHCVDDFLGHMPVVSGGVALAQRCARRLQSPRGRFKRWPNYGTDLRSMLLSSRENVDIARAAVAECEKDEQVQRAVAQASTDDQGRVSLAVQLTAITGQTFVFTMTISEAAATLISIRKGG